MNTTHTRGSSGEITSLLRLTSPAAHVVLVVFMVTNGSFLFWNLGLLANPVPCVLAFVIVMAAATALTTVAGELFSLGGSLAIVGVAVAATALVSWQLPQTGWPGYAAWHLGATSLLLFMLALRGRISLAWVGYVGVLAVTLVWCVESRRGILFGLGFTSRQAGILLIGSVFAFGLRRTAAQIGRLGRDQARREAQEAGALATLEERASRMTYVTSLAEPTLNALADVTEITPEIARAARVVEGGMRDLLRAAGLYRTPLVRAASEARHRGVEVVLLDDSSGCHSDEQLTTVVEQIAHELDALMTGQLTARLLPAGRDSVATVVAVWGTEIRRRSLG